MALPAAFFIRRFSYKRAILVGLTLYAIGALLAIPASITLSFPIFVLGSDIIHYGMEEVGLDFASAQKWNIASMILFLSCRFVCTWLMRLFQSGRLLMIFALTGLILVCGAIFFPGYLGLICPVGVSGCMSLMFPTIYGIALDGMTEEEEKLGSAFLIMSIVGGAVGAKL